MKRTGPVIFGFLIGMVMLLQYFSPHPTLLSTYNLILDWKQVVFGMTLILGIVSLVRFHSTKIRRKQDGWLYSIVTLAGLVAMSGSSLVWGTERGFYPWAFDNIQAPMQATMFALLAFYVASASYRAFRVRSLHAGLLLLAGVIVMLGRVPLGELIGITIKGQHYALPQLSTWILDVPNLAAKRGILIGVGLGMVATALKILLGIERSYLGKGA
ncbi:MAG: hypothetical protein KJ970_16605 [Candidatus Eisenbacteria bacterium]|uniref:Uncharacterized protein n=1 Tax=Eiseniibacteriota bacterium TaxID=2212470 RepID=A0A948RWX5_UNCEI|nr:hypothetical protein [Candidatus Eisenbacteria bacterium]MBU1950487.1 hypothetical protein [Candidatus Eisenbacteria bacterium]MBU2692538.1 hypothetical protein [Candidatus Eisenbacteria bacterium]